MRQRILSAGAEASQAMRGARGVTLLEALVAITLVGLAAALSFPAASAGVDAVRVRTATDEAKTFLLTAQRFADRHRQAVLVGIDPPLGRMTAHSADGTWTRSLAFDTRLRIDVPDTTYETVVQPGAALPPLSLALVAEGGQRSGFRVGGLLGDLAEWESGP